MVQAQYWHDPLDEETYREKSVFLADINNARPDAKNATYKENLLRLKKLVLIEFEGDTVVDPRQASSCFNLAPGAFFVHQGQNSDPKKSKKLRYFAKTQIQIFKNSVLGGNFA